MTIESAIQQVEHLMNDIKAGDEHQCVKDTRIHALRMLITATKKPMRIPRKMPRGFCSACNKEGAVTSNGTPHAHTVLRDGGYWDDCPGNFRLSVNITGVVTT